MKNIMSFAKTLIPTFVKSKLKDNNKQHKDPTNKASENLIVKSDAKSSNKTRIAAGLIAMYKYK